MGRPRVDVTLRVSGFFRDAFPNVMKLYDAAIQALANYDEAPEINTIRGHIEEQTAALEAQGMDKETAKRVIVCLVASREPMAQVCKV